MLHQPDGNGWLPIHEAARAGHVDVVKLLEENGADVNARTWWGEGQSVLSLAFDYHNEENKIIKYLMGTGAKEFGDEL